MQHNPLSTQTYALQKSINLIFSIVLKVEIFELSRIYLADSFYIQTNYDIKLPKEITFLYLIYQSFNAYMILYLTLLRYSLYLGQIC
jgi:hypothetical protein